MVASLSQNNPQGQGNRLELAARITRAGSKQTYYTFLLFADRDRLQQAFLAYAYYRWLDDVLDCDAGSREEKLGILTRQQAILDACYQGLSPGEVSLEEQMLVDLILIDKGNPGGLKTYLINMMAVMAFDVERCGREITEAELTTYTQWLSTAVTELLFYLIGHQQAPAEQVHRYDAVKGAHVIHMLRDMVEDIHAGYINIPGWQITTHPVSLEELHSRFIREWVYERVKLARGYFRSGRRYIAKVKNFRCRLAGFAYLSRFEWMLRRIERDEYNLQPDYPERKSLKAGIWMGWRTFISLLNIPWINLDPDRQAPLSEHGEGQ
jgi:phytoene/squalene synthetase